MRMTRFLAVVAAMLAVALVRPVSGGVAAQSSTAAALSGTVSSQSEGNMEGVLVTVRRDGAPFTVTVVTDAQGRYSFPRSHLAPGAYQVAIRAIGYDLDGSPSANVTAGKAAALNLTLRKTNDLSAQLTALEWMMSIPGTKEQKDLLARRPATCVFCHDFQRIVRSRHTAEQWIPVIQRMGTYNPDYTGLRRHQKSPPPANAPTSAAPPPPNQQTKDLAAYLATVNLGQSETWPYQLQTLPRPKGQATRVIVTQYDLPRRDSSVHDIDVDSQGNVWYGDAGFDYVGKLDPKTATFTEFKAPNALPAPPAIEGVLDVQVDKDDGLWAVVWGASIARLDTRTRQWRSYPLPEETRLNFIAPFHGRDSGTVWANAVRAVYRLDPKTGNVNTFANPYEKVPGPHAMYMVDRDSTDNSYFMDFFGSYIGRIDGPTGETTMFATPTRNAFPRRGFMDAQDRLWFGEFYADNIGMFDTRTKTFREFSVNRPYMAPYYARPDRNGEIWTSTQGSDRLLRLNPTTGAILEYLMPSYYDARKVVVDASSSRVTVWLPNKNTGQLVRVEPLD